MSDATNLKTYIGEELTYQDLNDQNDAFVARINERLESSDAVSTNTANKTVKRDASGNFAAGTITAALTGNVTGNLTGNVTGNVTGNLTGNVTGNVTGNLTGNADTATSISTGFTGMVAPFAMVTPPTGWLKCDGSAVSRTTYAALFTAISTTWGVGDNATTFNLPDLRGEFIRGYDDGKGTDSGRVFASSQAGDFGPLTYVNGSTTSTVQGGAYASRTFLNALTTAAVSGTETRPRNYALLYCIKT